MSARMGIKIEIISIGNELINGRVSDQNAGYAAARLHSLGFEVPRIIFIGDQERIIRFTLKEALKRSDVVLVSGGLGYTLDDITVEAAAKAFGRPLVLNRELQGQIRSYLTKQNIPREALFEKIAWLPQGSELLHPRPKACGFRLDEKGKPLFFLPGIPAEMRRILNRQVIPYLLHGYSGQKVIRQRVYHIFGLMEPEINARVRDLETKFDSLRLGFYPDFPENQLTVSLSAEKTREAERRLDAVEQMVEKRLSDYITSKDGQTLEEVVGDGLLQKKLTLSVAESCTGGLIGHRITAVPGSSDYFERSLVVYSNKAKKELLAVPPAVLSRHGAVSQKTAHFMAEGVRKKSHTDLGLAVTGIAGPGGGTPEKPVGTVWIGLSSSRGCKTGNFHFHGSRTQIKVLSAHTALNWVRKYLLDDTFLFSR
ncbi:MAG: competence/damage-inducible protein A [Thermodesulfobacteriota bacterium]